MKKILFGLIIGLAVGAVATWLFFKPKGDEESAGEKAAGNISTNQEVSRVSRKADGSVIVKLTKAEQSLMGLKVTPLQAVSLPPQIKAYGAVLDASPLVVVLTETAAARTTLEAAEKEYDRVKKLAANQDASVRSLEIAETAVKQARIQLDAIHPRLVAAWGNEIASYPNLPDLVKSLISRETLLVRLDVPVGQTLPAVPTGARIAPRAAEDKLVDAKLLGPVIAADPLTQGPGYLFLVKPNAIAMPIASAVIGWLQLPGQPEPGVNLPRAAVVRYQGITMVYLQTGDESFERTAAELLSPLDDGWLTRNLKPGNKVVTTGAQQLLSEELKGAMPKEEEK